VSTPGKATVTPETLKVTPDNFARAETDWYFAQFAARGELGTFYHYRSLPPIDLPAVRLNRDTLYSQILLDLDAGPVTLTLPNPGKRYMSLAIIDENHYARDLIYQPGEHTFTRNDVGTRYMFAAVRTLVDPADPKDLDHVHGLQDALEMKQPGGPGRFETPNWDETSRKKVKAALQSLGDTIPDLKRAFGPRDRVDPIRHLIGTATGWGGNPDEDAIYLNITPEANDGTGVYKLTVKEVPVDGFWSISVYDAQGHFVKNKFDSYTLNNITAKHGVDGSVTVQFGACDGGAGNCLPIFPGWNYMVRLYRPRKEILDGTWRFPETVRVS